jgi:TonB family protein
MNQPTHVIAFLLMVVVFEVPGEAQDHRARSQRQLLRSNFSIQNIDVAAADRAKIIEACELSNKPKPPGEIRIMSRLRGKAVSIPKPAYPKEAKSSKASGPVEVDVVVDEKGRVVWAKAVSGHPLLQDVARKAACRARYTPTRSFGRAVKTETIITYNFVTR